MIESNHERFEELAAGYALDALDADERREFEAHLEGCPECAETLARFFSAASDLGAGVPQLEAPVGLRDRVIDGVAAERKANGPSVRRSWIASTSKTVRYAVAAGVAALAVVSALTLVWVLDLRDDVASHERVLARSYDALSIMAEADQRWEIDAASGTARGIVAYDEDTGRSSIVVWGLDEDPGVRYNVWVREDTERTRVARLYAADGGFWALVPNDVLAVDGLGVTQVAANGDAIVVIDVSLASN